MIEYRLFVSNDQKNMLCLFFWINESENEE